VQAHIYADEDIVIIKAPWRPGFADALKNELPKGDRAWNNEDKVWECHPRHLETIVEIAQDYFAEVIVDESVEAFEAEKKQKPQRGQPTFTADEVRKLKVEWEKSMREKIEAEVRARYNWERSGTGKNKGPWDELRAILSQDDMKTVFRALAKKHHPDVDGNDGEKMKKLNAVFEKMGVK